MELVCVDPARVFELWPHVRGLIRTAMRRGGLSGFDPVEKNILLGKALVWLAWDGTRIHAAAVTQLELTEWRKACVIVACSGAGMDQWLSLIEGIEKFARAEGCACVRIIGRRGWERKLPSYRLRRIVLEKDIG